MAASVCTVSHVLYAGDDDDYNDVAGSGDGVLYVDHWLAILRWRANGQARPMLRSVHG